MPICTYLNPSEMDQPIRNKDVADALHDLRHASGENWVVIERTYEQVRFFRKPLTIARYELLIQVFRSEFQVINFYREEDGWDIAASTGVPAELVIAYMLGYTAAVITANARTKEA
jgi:hypothetical protein